MSRLLLLLLLLVLPLPALAANAELGVPDAGHPVQAGVPTLPVNGVWHYAACDSLGIGPDGEPGWLEVPPQNELISVSATVPTVFDITDLFLPLDHFEVYVDGVLALTTPPPTSSGIFIGPSYTSCLCPFADQAAVESAFGSPRYSHGSVTLPAGFHTINVKDLDVLGDHFGTGLAVRARPKFVPAPEK